MMLEAPMEKGDEEKKWILAGVALFLSLKY